MTRMRAVVGGAASGRGEVTPRTEILAVIALSVAGGIWGVAYLLAGVPRAAVWPWAFTALAVVSLWLYRHRGMRRALDLQLLASLLLPWILMIDLGGFAASGAVMLWSLVAPVTALLTSGFRNAVWWFGGYVALTAVAAVLEPGTPPPDALAPAWAAGFFFLNIVGVTSTVWLVIRHYVQQRAVLIARAEEARHLAETATRAKSDFLANMSHEIRTPMNAIIGMGVLLRDTDLSAEQRDLVAAIDQSSELLLSLINDVLDFSKIEAGRLELDSHPVEVRELVESALDIASPLAGSKNLDLVYLVGADVPRSVNTDGHRLRQVLVNLLSNAVKFTEEGEIALTVQQLPDSMLRCEVRDSGIGISEEGCRRLFEAFSQADASTTRKYGGTGLGLAISARLVELLGGRIEVASEPGVGSRFSFTVVAEPVDDAQGLDEHGALTDRRVLVVEPNATDRALLQEMLRGWQVQVDVASDEAQAVALLGRGRRADVVLLGTAPGDELGVHLNAARVDGLAVVALSRLAPRPGSDVSHADAVVTKPVRQSALYDALVDVCSGRPQRRRERSPAALDPELGRQAPMRILLAEDNLTNQRLAVRLLQRLGYGADVAGDGAEAVDAVRTGDYDLVLMDVQMPEVGGLDATRAIRELDVRQPVIIAMTANTSHSDRESCIEAGMDDYLSKPVRPEALVEALRSTYAGLKPAEPPPDIDVQSLRRLTDLTGDAEFVRTLLQEFRLETEEVLGRIQAAMPDDLAEVRLQAHSLKSSAANVGATALSASARDLELAADAGKAGDIRTQVGDLERSARSALRSLERLDGW